jgi:hypothetical protein
VRAHTHINRGKELTYTYDMDMERLQRRLRNGATDILDNVPSNKPPVKIERAHELGQESALTYSFFSPELQSETREATESLPNGYHLAHLIAGSKKEGTLHAHDYIIKKDERGVTLLYVDAEHTMGKGKREGILPRMGDIRPKIANLLALKIPNGDEPLEAICLRYRTERLGQDSEFFMPHQQLSLLEEMLEKQALPEALQQKEEEIVFRVHIGARTNLVQSRYTSSKDLETLLTGKANTPFLRGKTQAYSTIAGKFARHMRDGKFKPMRQPA